VPSLETALAYEVIFGVPVRELFAGTFQQIEKKTRRRMHLLANKLNELDPIRPADRRRMELALAVLENCRANRNRS
jgi:hypothetical protein